MNTKPAKYAAMLIADEYRYLYSAGPNIAMIDFKTLEIGLHGVTPFFHDSC